MKNNYCNAITLAVLLFISQFSFSQSADNSNVEKFSITKEYKIKSQAKVLIADAKDYCISPNNEYMGIIYSDALSKVYDFAIFSLGDSMQRNDNLKPFKGNTSSGQFSIGFSKDSKQFYTISDKMSFNIWEIKTGELLYSLGGNEIGTPGISNGNFYFDEKTGSLKSRGTIVMDKTMYVFDGNIKKSFKESAKKIKLDVSISEYAFSNSNQYVAVTGIFGKKAYLYNTMTGEFIKMFKSSKKYITKILFSPDDRKIIISEGKAITVFDISSGEIDKTILFKKFVADFTMSSQNILLVLTSDSKYRFFNLNNYEQLYQMDKEKKKSSDAIFSNDGKHLYMNNINGRIACWKIDYE